MSDEKKVETKFKGPGQWHAQAKRLEAEAEAKKKADDERPTPSTR